jgi:hypothetical protein
MSEPPTPPEMRFEQGAPPPSAERPRLKSKKQESRLLNGLFALGLLAGIALLTLVYVKQRMLESKEGTGKPKRNPAGELVEISKKKEEAFEEIKLNKAEINLTDLGLLDDAVKALEQYNEVEPTDQVQAQRLEGMHRRQHAIHAERLRAIAKQAEATAQGETSAESGEALRELGKALEAEKEIDQKWYFSGLVDKGKIIQLETRMRRIVALPIWQKTRALEVQAERFFKEKKLNEAEDCLKESMRLEVEFNEKYRDVLNTEFNRQEKLNGRLETIRSYPLQLIIENIEKEASASEGLNDWKKAASQWEEAARQVGIIINQYPASAFADRKYVTDLVKRRNCARARPEIETIQKEMMSMRQMLQRLQINPAITKARTLQARMNSIEMSNPGALPVDSPMAQEADYLSTHEGTLQVLLPALDRLMLPIPGSSSCRMLKHEVAQSFYSLVVGKNPSAVVRGTSPVESVTYEDAMQFCKQLSWITGKTARLPRLAEVMAAAGDLSNVPTRGQAWTFDSTDGLTVMEVAMSRPAATGFYDIIGNVEEWAESEAGTSVATVVGGNVNWVPTTGLPQRQAQKKERSRTLGFRFVIE